MDNVPLNVVPPKPAGQPEAITASLKRDGNALDPAACLDCLISPPLQEPQQRAFVDRQLLQGMTLEPRHDSGDEPTRLAHLDDRDQRGVLIEWRERSAQVVRLSHGAPIGCRCRAKVACPCRSPHSIYKRHGTTTLFAALDVLDGKVIGQCMARHRHQEFIRFLNKINRETPAGRQVHLIVDNYATHKHLKVRAWLGRHRRFHFHFTPTSASWLNAVEGLFAKLTRRRLKRGVFKGIADLQAAINRFLRETNDNPKPFIWTVDPDAIIEKVRRGKQVLASIH